MARTIHDLDPKTLIKGHGPVANWWKEDEDEPQARQVVRQATLKPVDEAGITPELTSWGKSYPVNSGYVHSKSYVVNKAAVSPKVSFLGGPGIVVCVRGKAKLELSSSPNRINIEDGTVYHLDTYEGVVVHAEETTHVRFISTANAFDEDSTGAVAGEDEYVPERRVESKAKEQLLALAQQRQVQQDNPPPKQTSFPFVPDISKLASEE